MLEVAAALRRNPTEIGDHAIQFLRFYFRISTDLSIGLLWFCAIQSAIGEDLSDTRIIRVLRVVECPIRAPAGWIDSI